MRRSAGRMNILVADGLDAEALALLRKVHDVHVEEVDAGRLLDAIPSFHALIVRGRTKVTKEVLGRGSNLKVVGRAGVGVDNIDVETATARKIVVVNAPTASTVSVAEVAKRAHAFGMEVIAFDPYLSLPTADSLGIRLVDKESLFRDADFVSVHAALTPETKGLVGREELALMKRTAVLVNCARGEIVQEGALAEALRSGTIAGAALDVFEKEPPTGSPLLAAPHVVFSTHLGASTKEAQARAGAIIADQVLKALEGKRPEFCVNPKVYG